MLSLWLFLQHFTPNYTEHAYLHWVENLYAYKTKDCDTTQVKRKCSRSRLPKQKSELNEIQMPAANTHTSRPRQTNKNLNNKIISRDLIDKVNEECEKSDRLTAARLDSIIKGNRTINPI